MQTQAEQVKTTGPTGPTNAGSRGFPKGPGDMMGPLHACEQEITPGLRLACETAMHTEMDRACEVAFFAVSSCHMYVSIIDGFVSKRNFYCKILVDEGHGQL